MFNSLERIYLQLKSFIKYITCNIFFKSEEPYYQQIPEEDIKNIFINM
jgi:hypothetical protein